MVAKASGSVLLLLAALCGSVNAAPFEATGRAIKVPDGDTFTLLTRDGQATVVRIKGIDAPERTQAYSQRARQALTDLLQEESVSIHCNKIDQYGRRVCRVNAGSKDVGLEMIRRGLAWHFKRHEKEQAVEEREAYATAEINAKYGKRGLWQETQPMSPWECRDRRKEGTTCR